MAKNNDFESAAQLYQSNIANHERAIERLNRESLSEILKLLKVTGKAEGKTDKELEEVLNEAASVFNEQKNLAKEQREVTREYRAKQQALQQIKDDKFASKKEKEKASKDLELLEKQYESTFKNIAADAAASKKAATDMFGEDASDIISDRISRNETIAQSEYEEGDIPSRGENKSLLDKLESLNTAVSALTNKIDSWVSDAASVLEESYGSVAAALQGSTTSFSDILDSVNSIGTSLLVKQSDIIKNVNRLAEDGISTDLEQLALLETIKDKSVAFFDTTSPGLRRLVLLNENLGNLTSQQFGLASILRRELNVAFGDNSYVKQYFQSYTETLLDAISANAQKGSTDSTNFYAVAQTFSAGLYEAGVSSSFVNSLMEGINQLGSGNISSLSSSNLQTLLLLAMDRAGLDYASILQQGLSSSDTYSLLAEIIDYLAEITDTTKDNNVLQNSYANLFSLSVTDLTAIKNLSENQTFASYAKQAQGISGDTTLAEVQNELQAIADERTLASAKVDNLMDNLKFLFGSGVVSSAGAYTAWTIGDVIGDIGTELSNFGFSAAGKVTSMIGGVTKLASGFSGLINVLQGVADGISAYDKQSNTLFEYFNSIVTTSTGGIYSNGINNSIASIANNSSSSFKSFSSTDTSNTSSQIQSINGDFDSWREQEEAESTSDKILKELEKTFMKAKESDGYAIAVSLQGMSDGVLRSMASIFADEEALADTMTGKNNALEKNNTFIDYVEDTSTNTAKA